jgi:hypothetical protein
MKDAKEGSTCTRLAIPISSYPEFKRVVYDVEIITGTRPSNI